MFDCPRPGKDVLIHLRILVVLMGRRVCNSTTLAKVRSIVLEHTRQIHPDTELRGPVLCPNVRQDTWGNYGVSTATMQSFLAYLLYTDTSTFRYWMTSTLFQNVLSRMAGQACSSLTMFPDASLMVVRGSANRAIFVSRKSFWPQLRSSNIYMSWSELVGDLPI